MLRKISSFLKKIETYAKKITQMFYFIVFLIHTYDFAFMYLYTQSTHIDNSKMVK